MAFHIDTQGIPTLRTYEKASKLEASIKPIRGRSDNCKPIGDRKKQHMSIRRDGNNVIRARLHNTDVVAFHEDGLIEINMGGWNSVSTRLFLQEVLGVNVMTKSDTPYILCSWWDDGVRKIGRLPLRTQYNTPNYFRREPETDQTTQTYLTYQNPIFPGKTKIHRKAALEEYKRYEPFKELLLGIGKVFHGGDWEDLTKAAAAADKSPRVWLGSHMLSAARGEEGEEGMMQAALLALLRLGKSKGEYLSGGGFKHKFHFEPKNLWAKVQKGIIEENKDRLTYQEEVRDGSMV